MTPLSGEPFQKDDYVLYVFPTFLEHTERLLSNDLSAPGFWLGVYIWQNGMTSGSLLFWGNTTINDLEVQSSEFLVSLNRWDR